MTKLVIDTCIMYGKNTITAKNQPTVPVIRLFGITIDIKMVQFLT